MFDFSRPELRVLANSESEMQRFESSATQNVKSARNRAGSGHFVDMARSPCAEVGSGDAAQVLRRDTGYHTSPLGADIAAVVRIPLPAHRYSVGAEHSGWRRRGISIWTWGPDDCKSTPTACARRNATLSGAAA